MKLHSSLQSHSVRRLLLIVPLICPMAFSACSGVAGTAHTNASINFQNSVTGQRQTGDNVTIGPATYDSEERGFESPWPFGPESTQQ